MTLAADFTAATKTLPAMLDLYRIAYGQRIPLWSGPVSGKREARQIAEQHGATPWNF